MRLMLWPIEYYSTSDAPLSQVINVKEPADENRRISVPENE